MNRLALIFLVAGGCWDFSSLGQLHDGAGPVGGGPQDAGDAEDAGAADGDGSPADAAPADDATTTGDAAPADAAPADAAPIVDARPPADLIGLPTAFTAQSSPTSTALNGVWGSSSKDVYVVGGITTGVILHSTGGAWSSQLSSGGALQAVWGSSAGDVYAVGNGGTILHSTGNGSWSLESSGTTANLRGVWGPSPQEIYAAGSGVILRSTGNGTWTQEWSSGDAYLLDVAGANGEVWVVGSSSTATTLNGLIVHKHAGAWTPQLTQPDEILQGAWATAGDAVLVGGATQVNDSRILRGGNPWTVVTTAAANHQTLFGVWGSGAGDVYAVGHTGVMVRCVGTVWQSLGGQPSTDLFRVWGSAPDDVYAVGENGVILHLP